MVAAVVLLCASPFIIAATDHRYWDGMAPAATLLVFGVCAALVLRYRWAWWALLLLHVAVLASTPFGFPGIVPTALNALTVVLLLTPQMRSYIRAPRRTAYGANATG